MTAGICTDARFPNCTVHYFFSPVGLSSTKLPFFSVGETRFYPRIIPGPPYLADHLHIHSQADLDVDLGSTFVCANIIDRNPDTDTRPHTHTAAARTAQAGDADTTRQKNLSRRGGVGGQADMDLHDFSWDMGVRDARDNVCRVTIYG